MPGQVPMRLVPQLRMLGTAQRALLLGTVAALVMVLAAGLTVAVVVDRSGATIAARDLRPFEQALADLSQAPGLRYRTDAAAGTPQDITVTASGDKFGAAGSDADGGEPNVLQVSGKTFTRGGSGAAGGTGSSEGWTIGAEGAAGRIAEVLDGTPAPPVLADDLSRALRKAGDVPQPEDSASAAVDGKPAKAVNTPAGRLLITRQAPHRVLRLEPVDGPARKEPVRSGVLPAAAPLDGGSGGFDLAPVTGAEATEMYDTLEKQVGRLENATDAGITFTLGASGSVNCGSGGCTANKSFTGTLTSAARARIAGGNVTAVMTATFSIDGRSAGRCTSDSRTFPVAGGGVSGTLSCSNPGAGAVFTSVNAQHRARAMAQSRAQGGRPVRYRIPFRANTVISARALAAVEVKRLVERVNLDRDLAKCTGTNSFVPGTRVLMADGRTKAIEDVRIGDAVLAADPETGETGPGAVVATPASGGPKDLVRITTAAGPGTEAGTVVATAAHPFRVAGGPGRWVDAGALKPGMRLRTGTGADVRVAAVEHRTVRDRRVHNLTVADAHTYHVRTGGAHVLVHNANCFNMIPWGNGAMRSPAKLVYRPGSRHGHRLRHIQAHGDRAPVDPSKTVHSRFNTHGRELFRLIDDAWEIRASGTKTTRNGTDEYVIPMNRVVGTQGEKAVRIIVEEDTGNILTAHPVPF
ncbi:polymorphic toxin-type HINT domain-containing protein [Actinomadura rifamycini]|uniref:polymorphic toxin-type HINT domain-containing protein n=1 Tax=Actinomadura rifamycini TaxID=31962 RepID=UPI00041F2215|nr:polymorphic toxin-type HINT domain-containing protein [Actinomadura rifamycini]